MSLLIHYRRRYQATKYTRVQADLVSGLIRDCNAAMGDTNALVGVDAPFRVNLQRPSTCLLIQAIATSFEPKQAPGHYPSHGVANSHLIELIKT